MYKIKSIKLYLKYNIVHKKSQKSHVTKNPKSPMSQIVCHQYFYYYFTSQFEK